MSKYRKSDMLTIKTRVSICYITLRKQLHTFPQYYQREPSGSRQTI